MKKSVLFSLALSVALYSCSGSKNEENHEEHAMHESESSSSTVNQNASTTPIIDAYLTVKESLVNDNATDAAEQSKALTEALKSFDLGSSAGDIEELERIQIEAIQLSESMNSDDISIQRESFQALSVMMKDFLQIAGTDRTLYHQYCPMYKNNTGGMWLSASEDIKNPLFGSSMLNCGAVEDTIKAM